MGAIKLKNQEVSHIFRASCVTQHAARSVIMHGENVRRHLRSEGEKHTTAEALRSLTIVSEKHNPKEGATLILSRERKTRSGLVARNSLRRQQAERPARAAYLCATPCSPIDILFLVFRLMMFTGGYALCVIGMR